MRIEDSITGEPSEITGSLEVERTAYNGVEVYIAPRAGPITEQAVSSFSIQVVCVGGVATEWDVRLEGSLDGINFTTCLTHTTALGNGDVLFSGATLFPCRFFRSRCVSLVLGQATNILVYIIGV